MKNRNKALERLRSICLALPETVETDSWDHPNFRAGKRTFAAFEWIKGRPSIAVCLDSNEVDAFLLASESAFATPYGRGKWLSLWADTKPDWNFVETLVENAYRRVALKRMLAALDAEKKGTA